MAGKGARPPADRATGAAQPDGGAGRGPQQESYGPLVISRPGKDDGRALILYEATPDGGAGAERR
jgi:hypothetical protein